MRQGRIPQDKSGSPGEIKATNRRWRKKIINEKRGGSQIGNEKELSVAVVFYGSKGPKKGGCRAGEACGKGTVPRPD